MRYVIITLFLPFFLCAQVTLVNQNITINRHIDGSLLLPQDIDKPPLAIIIAGSGPTDRDGNQNFMKNNSLKKLAEGLTKEGVATFRYDKRIVKQIRLGEIDENIMFDDFVTDAIDVVKHFKEKYSFSKIYVVGHSQGSLVGLLAAHNEPIDGFISLAGAGKSIDEVITDQIVSTAPQFKDDTERVFAILKEGNTTDDFPLALASVFNKGVQPFMSNWMQYNPQDVIKTLAIPTLIINGTKDLQVSPEEAKLLDNAAKNSSMIIVDKMNHILVAIEGDNLENSKSYNEAQRPLSPDVLMAISNFISKNK